MTIAIIANPEKYKVSEAVRTTVSWAGDHGVPVILSKTLAAHTLADHPSGVTLTDDDSAAVQQSDLVVVVGGDGSILYTAQLPGIDGKPVLGVNSGRLGFMTNIQHDELRESLDQLPAGNYTLDKRHYLKATDKNGNEYFALNEFLFARKDSTSMINIRADYDGNYINTYWADGLLIASPTGSTAYNLSTGGPIVAPGSEVMLVTPINPHTLTTRSLVLKADKAITITVTEQQSSILFSYDGVLNSVDELPFQLEIVRSDRIFNLINLPGQNYFDTLRKKLMWGQDSRKKR